MSRPSYLLVFTNNILYISTFFKEEYKIERPYPKDRSIHLYIIVFGAGNYSLP